MYLVECSLSFVLISLRFGAVLALILLAASMLC